MANWLFAALSLWLFTIALHAVPQDSVKSGVYTKEQADRGAETFKTSCASCHALAPKGTVTSDAPGPDLAGDEFLTKWNGKPAAKLAQLIHDTMPNDGSIDVTEPMSLDLVAFLLRTNGFPDGANPLTADTAKATIVK